jgi:hypothetical protein
MKRSDAPAQQLRGRLRPLCEFLHNLDRHNRPPPGGDRTSGFLLRNADISEASLEGDWMATFPPSRLALAIAARETSEVSTEYPSSASGKDYVPIQHAMSRIGPHSWGGRSLAIICPWRASMRPNRQRLDGSVPPTRHRTLRFWLRCRSALGRIPSFPSDHNSCASAGASAARAFVPRRRVHSCAGFRTPATTIHPHARAAGVRKPPTAGCGPRSCRALWGFRRAIRR